MGDLKKKIPQDYVIKNDDAEILIENQITPNEEQIIESLRGYIQKFYEIQEEKLKKEDCKRKGNKKD